MHPCMTILGCAELGRAFPSEGHFRTKGNCHGECQGLGSLWAKLGDIKSCWKLSDQKKHSGIENGSNHSNHSTLQPAVFPSLGETMIVQRDVFLEMQMSQKSNSRVVPLGESSDVGSSMALLAVREETAGRSKAVLRFQQTNIGFTRALSPITQYHGRYLFCFWIVSYLLTWKSTVLPCVDCWVDLHRSGHLARKSFGSPWLWARGRDEFTEPIQTSDALPGVMTCDVMTHGMWSHLTHWPMDRHGPSWTVTLDALGVAVHVCARSVPCWLWLESLWWLCTDELPLFHGQDQVIFFPGMLRTQSRLNPKMSQNCSVLPLKFLKLWLETRHRRHH